MTKQPPVTLRIPADLRAEVEAWAARSGQAKNAVYVEAVRRGVAAMQAPGGPSPPQVKRTEKSAEGQGDVCVANFSERLQLGPTHPKPGAMLIDKKRKR